MTTHHRNINAIGKSNSGALLTALKNAELADEIIRIKELEPFKDYDDLQRRVKGVGPKRINDLKAAGFIVELRAGGGSSNNNNRNSANETLSKLSDIRGDVESLKDQTWRHRENACLYTLKKKKDVEKETPEVDHVIECQIINYANEITSSESIAYRTKGSQDTLKSLFNSVNNLNVTTHYVNQKKKGPFSTWIHNHEKGTNAKIEDILSTSKAKELRDDGTWSNIEKSMIKIWDEMDEATKDIREDAKQRHAKRILDEVQSMMGKMGIE